MLLKQWRWVMQSYHMAYWVVWGKRFLLSYEKVSFDWPWYLKLSWTGSCWSVLPATTWSFVRHCIPAEISRGATQFLLIQCSIPSCWDIGSFLNVVLGKKKKKLYVDGTCHLADISEETGFLLSTCTLWMKTTSYWIIFCRNTLSWEKPLS